MLYSILGVAQTLRLLAVLAATWGAAVAARAVPSTLTGRDGKKENKNAAACNRSILRFDSNVTKKNPACKD